MNLLNVFLAAILLTGQAFGLDAVATRVILETKTHYIAHFTNISDGTGEADVAKVDKSAIGVASDGAEAGSLDIDQIAWSTNGMAVNLEWDHTTDDLAMALSGNGLINFKGLRDLFVPGFISTLGMKDPRSSGQTGDILFTTVGHSSGDTYNITLWLRKNPD